MIIYLIHSSGLTISTGAVSCWCHLFPTKKGVLQQNYAQKTHASSCQTINQKAKNWNISQSVVLSGCTLWKQICFILSLSNYLKNELEHLEHCNLCSLFTSASISPSFFLLLPFSTFRSHRDSHFGQLHQELVGSNCRSCHLVEWKPNTWQLFGHGKKQMTRRLKHTWWRILEYTKNET